MTDENQADDDPFQELANDQTKRSNEGQKWTAKRPDPFSELAEEDKYSSWSTLNEETTASQIIVNRIAKIEDCYPCDLPPLDESIPVEALDALAASESIEHIDLWYFGHKIQIQDGRLRIGVFDISESRANSDGLK